MKVKLAAIISTSTAVLFILALSKVVVRAQGPRPEPRYPKNSREFDKMYQGAQ